MAVFDVLFTTIVLAVLIAEGKIRWRLGEFVHPAQAAKQSLQTQMMRKNDHEAFLSWSKFKSLKQLIKFYLMKELRFEKKHHRQK